MFTTEIHIKLEKTTLRYTGFGRLCVCCACCSPQLTPSESFRFVGIVGLFVAVIGLLCTSISTTRCLQVHSAVAICGHAAMPAALVAVAGAGDNHVLGTTTVSSHTLF